MENPIGDNAIQHFNGLKVVAMHPMFHPELSGCITTLSVCNTWRLQTFVQQWTP